MILSMRWIVAILVIVGLLAGGAWWSAGRMPGPSIAVNQPAGVIGQSTPLDVAVETPDGRLSQLDVILEQGGKSYPVFSLSGPSAGALKHDAANRVSIAEHVGKKEIP